MNTEICTGSGDSNEKTATFSPCGNIDIDALPATQNLMGYTGYLATIDGGIVRNGKVKQQRRARRGMRVDIGKSSKMVHDLVIRAYFGHPMVKGYRVKHRSRDRTDNRPDNLLWAGSPRPQLPTTPLEIERECERIELERLELIELMQT